MSEKSCVTLNCFIECFCPVWITGSVFFLKMRRPLRLTAYKIAGRNWLQWLHCFIFCYCFHWQTPSTRKLRIVRKVWYETLKYASEQLFSQSCNMRTIHSSRGYVMYPNCTWFIYCFAYMTTFQQCFKYYICSLLVVDKGALSIIDLIYIQTYTDSSIGHVSEHPLPTHIVIFK